MSWKRSSKREIIDDEESSSEQPAVKRRSESSPSPDVVELRGKVAELDYKYKLEKNFQSKCRISGDDPMQLLEKLVDKKPKLVDAEMNTEREEELEKKVDDLENQLEEMVSDRYVRFGDLTGQLIVARTEAEYMHGKNIELSWENHELKLELAEMGRFAQQPYHMVGYVQLPQQQPPPLQQLLLPPPPPAPIRHSRAGNHNEWMLHKTAHPTNILQMCRPNAQHAISLDSALKRLDVVMKVHGKQHIEKYLGQRLMSEKYGYLKCEGCWKLVANGDVISHFQSGEHSKKVRAYCGSVSFAAYQHWFRPLEHAWAAPAPAASSRKM